MRQRGRQRERDREREREIKRGTGRVRRGELEREAGVEQVHSIRPSRHTSSSMSVWVKVNIVPPQNTSHNVLYRP